MTVMFIATIQNFMGLSTDAKPTGAPPGSTFFEYDTKNTYKTYDGTNWTFFDSIFQLTGMKAATVDLKQAAGAHLLYTATTQNVWVNSLIIRLPNVNVSDDVGAITGISIQTDDGTPQVLLAAALGVKANLTAEKQFICSTPILLVAGKKINLTIIGGAADDPTVCDVVAIYQAVVSGGYLA
ncbi:MAG: hypothetical protein ABSH06_00260 [Thermodesulfobacteriota bacterium]